MRRELVVKTRSLCGVSDLTLLAPIKQGLVPSLETVTYKTRTKRLLEALSTGRASSHEYALWRPISDSVERVGKIHSVRVAVLEPEDKVLLAVTFDGAWESYIRVLWQKVGTLLDVIFCNTEDYVSTYGHSFEEWKAWAERVQVETAFFYGMPGLTVGDVDYLRQAADRPLAAAQAPALAAVRATVRSAEKIAQDNVKARGAATIKEMGRQGLLALASIHRLTSMYLPGEEDGEYLRRAARDLLLEFVQQNDTGTLKPIVVEGRNRFDEQLTWLLAPTQPRRVPGTPKQSTFYDATDVQGGIVNQYVDTTHGCLLLMAFARASAAANFLKTIQPLITRDSAVPAVGNLVMNVAFTYEGLRAIGLSDAQLACFPQEFREGMAARAGVLGDVRTNHPRRWRLPERNWPPSATPPTQKVELLAVHVVLQLRIAHASASYDFNDPEHPFPLHDHVTTLLDKLPGVKLLSVQPMARHLKEVEKPEAEKPKAQEHFGFVDGEGQPVIDPAKAPAPYGRNAVQLGELLLGYANEADEAPDPLNAPERHRLLHNGSFLVVRKLHQDVEALSNAVEAAGAQTKLGSEKIYAKMMGRKRDGTPLVQPIDPTLINNFDYEDDPLGKLCPFHAHIRRANPRLKNDPNTPPGGRTPRITRRGMPYGPLFSTHPAVAERGLMFMAYNASISEQFEVVQRWLSGGNSSGGYSGQSDPFFGVAENGKKRFFEFEDETTNTPWRIALDGSPDPLTDPRPFVRLEWGCYLFAPSIKALNELFKAASNVQDSRPVPPWSAAAGMKDIQMLRETEQRQGAERALEAWKTLLEDPQAQEDCKSASVWAAIRAYHGGVLRTPYGVIVASHSRVMEVLDNAAGHYSVSGYHQRMTHSIGEIFLGLDDDKTPTCPYQKQSEKTNGAIGLIKREEAFDLARDSTTNAMNAFVMREKFLAKATGETRWELQLAVKEVVDKVLEDICMQWFGLAPQQGELAPGGARWDWKEGDDPRYPGNFTAPSRYLFQPQPGTVVEELGRLYGRTLTAAFGRLVKRHRDDGTVPKNPKKKVNARLAETIFNAFPSRLEDELVARTMVGALMGFIPTVDGNLRLSLNEWLRDGTFWELRSALAGADPNKTPYQRATELLETPLIKAMQLRPSPELVWRTAKTHHKIGDVEIWPEDKIVVALVSATHESLEQNDPDTYPIFGGDRSKQEHPTHACPAYEAAMGLLLGMLSAMLEFTETMRPSPAALALSLEGNFPAPTGTPLPPPPNSPYPPPIAPPPPTQPRPEVVKPPMILGAGDSWFDYSPVSQPGKQLDMLQMLRDRHGFDTVSLAEAGHTLEAIASKQQLDALCDRFKDLVARGRPPVAIVLSAGVNDVVYEKRWPLFEEKTEAGGGGLNEEQVDELVDVQMQDHFVTIFARLAQDCRHEGQPVPVFFHGYAYPVPDGRNAFDIEAPLTSWFSRPLLARKYTALSDRIDVMRQLIVRLNDMQIVAAKKFGGNVFHVDLRAQLSNDPDPETYKQDWANELHPTERGFEKITKKLVDQMARKIPALKAASKSTALR